MFLKILVLLLGLVVVVVVDSNGFWCEFFLLFCFTLLKTHNVKYFPENFPKM